jgi:RNA polymerase sigma-70 factor (ECF subfamily)
VSTAGLCSILLAMPSAEALLSRPADSDAAAVSRFQAGDGSAFEDLVARREAEIYRLALRMLGNPDDALEATQDVFLRVYRALPRFRGEAAFRTWITGIALNVCRSRRTSRAARDRKRDVPLESTDREGGGGGGPSLPAAPGPDPERATQGAELRVALERALAGLTPEHREIILLREVQGLDYDELAATLGCAAGTVKSRLARARGALRAAMEGLWP